jgi:transcription initiation factor IIE alpha subunit
MMNLNVNCIIKKTPKAISYENLRKPKKKFVPPEKTLMKLINALVPGKESTIERLVTKTGMDKSYVFRVIRELIKQERIVHDKRTGDSGVPETFISLPA